MTARTTQPRRGLNLSLLALPIAAKLGLVLALVLLASSLLTSQLVSRVVYNAQTDVVATEMVSLSRVQAARAAEALERELLSLESLTQNANVQAQLRVLADDPGQAAITDPIQRNSLMFQQVQPFKLLHPEFDAVALLDVWGHVVALDPLVIEGNVPDAGGWEWFDSAASTGSVFISGPRLDQLTGREGVHIALPIYDARQPDRMLGVAYAVWNLSNLPDVDPVRSRESVVIEPDGTIISASNIAAGTSLPRDLLEELRAAPGGTLVHTDKDGTEWLYGYTRLSDATTGDSPAGALGWVVITREPLAVAAAATAALTGRIQLAIGLSAVLITLVAAMVALRLLAPLRHLTEAADSLRAGDLHTPIPVLPLDEVGRLSEVLRGLVARLTQRVRQLDAAVQVSRVASRSLDLGLDDLMTHVVQAVTVHFGYPAVRIYRVDASRREVRLQAASGHGAGELPRGEAQAATERTVVGRTALFDEIQIQQAGDSVTGVPEVALPLRAVEGSGWVLHVRGKRGVDFEPEEIDLLNLIADQISTALENARLYETSAASLSEIEALNRRLTRQVWQDRLQIDGTLRHTRDPEGRWPRAIEEVRAQDEIVAEIYTDPDGRAVLAAPLMLRGEVVGTLAVARQPGRIWREDERLLMEAIASRLAMVAESIRLVEETTWQAEREQRINQVSGSLLERSASMDDVLRTALGELSSVFGSEHVSLRLGAPPGDKGNGAHVRIEGSGGLKND